MAETASILSPEKTVLIPDLDAGCSLADSITADQLRAWQAKHPGAVTVMYVNTTAEIKALTDYCVTSSNAVDVVEHILREHGQDTEILFGPDMFLGAYVEKRIGRPLHVWDGECHVHAGIRPSDIERIRAEHPGADFLIHPECGCSTSVMEYVAAGDVDPRACTCSRPAGCSTTRAAARAPAAPRSWRPRPACCTRCAWPRPTSTSSPPTREASCVYMKMITLPKLRDGLRDGVRRGARARRPSPSARGSRSSAWSRSLAGRRTHSPAASTTASARGARTRPGWPSSVRTRVAVVVGRDGVLMDGDAPARGAGRRRARADPAGRRRRRPRAVRRRGRRAASSRRCATPPRGCRRPTAACSPRRPACSTGTAATASARTAARPP